MAKLPLPTSPKKVSTPRPTKARAICSATRTTYLRKHPETLIPHIPEKMASCRSAPLEILSSLSTPVLWISTQTIDQFGATGKKNLPNNTHVLLHRRPLTVIKGDREADHRTLCWQVRKSHLVVTEVREGGEYPPDRFLEPIDATLQFGYRLVVENIRV
jgi:hypothetical protein